MGKKLFMMIKAMLFFLIKNKIKINLKKLNLYYYGVCNKKVSSKQHIFLL